MEWFEALILGVLQGLTEYLPVSSSGHLAIGSALFGIQGEDNLTFTIAVHVATVLSTLVILWKEIGWIFRGLFKFEMNAETKYVINILVSMIPIGIVGVFFKDYVERNFRFRLAHCRLYAVIDSFASCFLLLCKTSFEREHQHEGCVYYRSGTGLCRDAGIIPFGYYHCYRFVVWETTRRNWLSSLS